MFLSTNNFLPEIATPSMHRFLPAMAALSAAFLPAQNTNVAVGGTANWSSTLGFGSQPGFGIDGNRDGYWWNNSCVVTGNNLGAWWEVTLASAGIVNEVVIWNRADCCATRLSQFRVDVLNGANVAFSQSLYTTGNFAPAGASVRVRIPGAGVNATKVRLTNIGVTPGSENVLSFSEVEVIRYGAGREVNFARYGTASASHDGATANRAIDGSTNGHAPSNRAWLSSGPTGQTLSIAMTRHRVDAIRLWPISHPSSSGVCGNFRVGVYDNGVEVWGQDQVTNIVRTAATVFTPPAGLFGNELRITRFGASPAQLAFAEVESLQFANDLGEQWEYGAGCRGTGSLTPQLSCAQRPVLGTTVTLRTGTVPGPGVGVLAVGLSDALFGGLPLPLDLGLLGAPGCQVLGSVDATATVLATTGVSTAPFPLPNVPTLAGVWLFHQTAWLSPGANTFGLVLSDGLAQRIGL
jgi:hypothetical protein